MVIHEYIRVFNDCIVLITATDKIEFQSQIILMGYKGHRHEFLQLLVLYRYYKKGKRV